MKKIKLISLFAGIGAMEFGAKRIYDEVEIVAAAEIDKYARISYMANHKIDESKFYSDVKLLDGKNYKKKYDCLCFGFPCQDYSIAGLRAGLDGQKGTLFYEAARILKDSMPEMFIAENVKGLLSSNKGKDFKVIMEILRDIGYHIHYEVLNTKDYGIPQNRERIFIVGFLDHEQYYRFQFAPKIKLEKRLKDVLEKEVDEKYYLSKEKQIKIKNSSFSQEKDRLHYSEDIVKTVLARDYKDPKCVVVGILDLTNSFGEDKTREYTEYSPALQSERFGLATMQNYRIRKLTPRECFRLQDFPDTFKFVVSNSQLYKQVGNSISVNVMEMIFRQIEKSRTINLNGGLF